MSLLTAVAKIGGYFSFFGVFLIVIQFYHKCLFERRLKKINPDFKTIYSYERLEAMNIELIELREIVKNQKKLEKKNEFEKIIGI